MGSLENFLTVCQIFSQLATSNRIQDGCHIIASYLSFYLLHYIMKVASKRCNERMPALGDVSSPVITMSLSSISSI